MAEVRGRNSAHVVCWPIGGPVAKNWPIRVSPSVLMAAQPPTRPLHILSNQMRFSEKVFMPWLQSMLLFRCFRFSSFKYATATKQLRTAHFGIKRSYKQIYRYGRIISCMSLNCKKQTDFEFLHWLTEN